MLLCVAPDLSALLLNSSWYQLTIKTKGFPGVLCVVFAFLLRPECDVRRAARCGPCLAAPDGRGVTHCRAPTAHLMLQVWGLLHRGAQCAFLVLMKIVHVPCDEATCQIPLSPADLEFSAYVAPLTRNILKDFFPR